MLAVSAHVLSTCVVALMVVGASFASDSESDWNDEGAYLPGLALANVWSASPAQYQATAEVVLEAVGASNYETVGAFDAAITELLVMFTGGNGAAQDVMDRKRDRSGRQVIEEELED